MSPKASFIKELKKRLNAKKREYQDAIEQYKHKKLVCLESTNQNRIEKIELINEILKWIDELEL